VLGLVLLHLLHVTCLIALGSILEWLLLLRRQIAPHLTELLGDFDSRRLRPRVVVLQTCLGRLAIQLLELHESRKRTLGGMRILLPPLRLALAFARGVALLALLVVVMMMMMMVMTLLVTRMAYLLCRRTTLHSLGLGVTRRLCLLAFSCSRCRCRLGLRLLLAVTANNTIVLL